MHNSSLLPDPEWFSGGITEYSSCTIHEIFEENARQYPQNIALIGQDEKLTYDQLNQKANQLAHALQKLTLPLETPVAVLLTSGIDLVVALLAILKIGCAYVPLDIKHSKERNELILQDCQAKALITHRDFSAEQDLNFLNIRLVFLDCEIEDISKQSVANLNIFLKNTHLAYICYTSGSRGCLKGVMIEHRGIVRLVKATNYIHIQGHDRIAQVIKITFDIAGFEIWGALLNAAALVC